MSYGKLSNPLKALKQFKCFNILKISLKTLLKTIKNNFFKERRFLKFLLHLKNRGFTEQQSELLANYDG